MRITAVALENIATHVKTRIPFSDGINVLSGLNGAGKSTVLKMIGYVLFDYLTGSQADYVRHGEASGSATIYFTGKDGNEYTLKRNIGGGNTMPHATNVFTGMDVNFASRKDAFNWIHDQMGIDRSVDLKSLFQNSIGVDQGTFTIPFSKPAGERKKIFGPVLNVDIYEHAYTNAREITNALKEDIQVLDVKISGLRGEISPGQEHQAELEAVQADLSGLAIQKVQLQKGLASMRAELQSLDTLKEKRDALRSEGKNLDSTMLERQKVKERVEKELTEARNASAACNATRQDHDTYAGLSVQERELQPRLAALESVRKQCNDIESEIQGTKKLIADISARMKIIEADKVNLPWLERSAKEHAHLVDEISGLNAELHAMESKQKELADLARQRQELHGWLDRNQVDEQEVSRLQDVTAQLEPMDQQRIKSVEAVAQIKAAIKQAAENKNASKDGMCPFLKDACKNIKEQSLGQHFQKEIEALDARLAKETRMLEIAVDNLANLRAAKQKLDSLVNARVLVASYRSRLDELQGRIVSLEAQLAKRAELEAKRVAHTARRDSLAPAVQSHAVLKRQVETEFPRLSAERESKAAYVAKLEEALQPLKKYIGDLAAIQAQLDEIRRSMAAKKENHDTFVRNTTAAEKLPSLESSFVSTRDQYEQAKASRGKVARDLAEVDSQYDEPRHKARKEATEKASNQLAGIMASEAEKSRMMASIKEKLKKIEEKRVELDNIIVQHDELVSIEAFNTTIRDWFKQAGPIITKALMHRINKKADDFIKLLSGSNDVNLEWKEDFDVVFTTPLSVKSFSQLSGGEQMAAALSIRLAILRVLSNLDFAFFDEPTTNLDLEKRENLAQCIKTVGMSKGFTQLFVISHDDTFERYADNVVHFTKDAEENTKINGTST